MIVDNTTKNFLRTLASGEDPNIDIIAVHGLNPHDKAYHAEETWKSGDKLWLRDFLPSQLPRARILLFGYNSNVAFQSSSAGVREQAINLLNRLWLERQDDEDRPILFIAHSLGGIVVKEALVQAKLGERYNSIYAATYGIAFFGTPHRGSPYAGIGDIAAKVVRGVLRNPSNTFMKALKKAELYAGELFQNFQQQSEKYQFLSFYETRPLKKIGVIVDKSSAVLNLPDARETRIALDADHKTMCKFASPDEENYKHVSANIVHLANSATKAFEERSLVEDLKTPETMATVQEPEPSIFMMPYSRNPDFVGRETILQRLNDRFASLGEVHARVALFGLGGVGKSQIAIQLAHQIREERHDVSIFWIHASNIDRFRDGYRKLAQEYGIPDAGDEEEDQLSRVKTWLENERQSWLMIIDNADDISLFASDSASTKNLSILDYLPECSQGSILITTRNRAAGVSFTRNSPAHLIEVQTMSERESTGLIKSKLMENIAHESEIHELTSLLEHLPLALVQAAAFMQENVMSIREYLELYRDGDETQMELLCEPFEALGRDSGIPNAVAATLMISINQIKERNPRAVEILSLMGFLDRHEIPKAFIERKKERPLDIVKALGTLKAFSLIVEGGVQGTYSMHRLVQLVVRKWLAIQERYEAWAIQALERVAELYPNATFENWKVCAEYLPHARAVLQLVPELQGKDLRTRLYLQEGISFYLWSQGRYKESEAIDLLILEENKKEFGLEHPETLESMGSLASTYEDQGRFDEAEELDRHVVEVRRKQLGPEHRVTLTSMANLASIYEKQGRTKKAEDLMLQVFETRKRVFGPDDDETLDSMAHLGSIYTELEQWERAEELELRVWNLRKERHGPDHKDTLTTEHMLALIYSGQGQKQKAEQLNLRVLRAREERLGPQHPETLCTKNNLAAIYHEQGELDKAEDLILQVLEAREEQLESNHPDILYNKQTLAQIHYSRGHFEEAEALGVEVLKAKRNRLGPDHTSTLIGMNDLAWARMRLGKKTEAVELMTEVVRLQMNKLGPDHPDTKESVETLDEWCKGGDETLRSE
ncbi:hypothetical protein VTN02DRAFT_3893 [Thermoascus thermophilus]